MPRTTAPNGTTAFQLAGDGLQLRYDIRSHPERVTASAPGANPNVVDLDVLLSPTMQAATVTRIQIRIPVGGGDAVYLSTAADLPAPEYDRTQGWDITTNHDTVTIQPSSHKPMQVTAAIEFHLRGIVVNEAPGDVPVSITEIPPAPAPKRGPVVQNIVKWQSEDPLVKFWAEPENVTDYDQAVTLHWRCTDTGKDYAYAVWSRDLDWHPNDCQGAGDCLTTADGVDGVRTKGIDRTAVTFFVDAYKADSGGGRTLQQRMAVDVAIVGVPHFERTLIEEVLPNGSGRLWQIRWLAHNTARCEVKLDGKVIDANAPADVYESGYLVFVSGNDRDHLIRVTAHAKQGGATDQHDFSIQALHAALVTTTDGREPSGAAFTPDGRHAFVAYLGSASADHQSQARDYHSAGLRVLDTTSGQVTTFTLTSVAGVTMAKAPEGWVALFGSTFAQAVGVVALSPAIALEHDILVRLGAVTCGVAASADGSVARSLSYGAVAAVDLAARKAHVLDQPQHATAIAVVPGGSATLALSHPDMVLHVLPVSSAAAPVAIPLQPVLPATDPPGFFELKMRMAIRVAPDGTFALVTSPQLSYVVVVDLVANTVDPNVIPLAHPVRDIAVLPDGRGALAASEGGATLVALDIPHRTARNVAGWPASSGPPSAVAFWTSPDRSAIAVASQSGVITIV